MATLSDGSPIQPEARLRVMRMPMDQQLAMSHAD